MAPTCVLCAAASATIYCENDKALLCEGCDVKIHTGNAVAARHVRHLVCEGGCGRAAALYCHCDSAHMCTECHGQNPLSGTHRVEAASPLPAPALACPTTQPVAADEDPATFSGRQLGATPHAFPAATTSAPADDTASYSTAAAANVSAAPHAAELPSFWWPPSADAGVGFGFGFEYEKEKPPLDGKAIEVQMGSLSPEASSCGDGGVPSGLGGGGGLVRSTSAASALVPQMTGAAAAAAAASPTVDAAAAASPVGPSGGSDNFHLIKMEMEEFETAELGTNWAELPGGFDFTDILSEGAAADGTAAGVVPTIDDFADVAGEEAQEEDQACISSDSFPDPFTSIAEAELAEVKQEVKEESVVVAAARACPTVGPVSRRSKRSWQDVDEEEDDDAEADSGDEWQDSDAEEEQRRRKKKQAARAAKQQPVKAVTAAAVTSRPTSPTAPAPACAAKASRAAIPAAAAAPAVPVDGANMTREQRVARYLEKKKSRRFGKTIRYAARKAYAEIRPRIKGRFARKDEIAAWKAANGGEDAVVPEFLDIRL